MKVAAPHVQHTSGCRSISTSSKHAHTTVQVHRDHPVSCQAVNHGQHLTEQHQQQRQHKQPLQQGWPLPYTHQHGLDSRQHHCAQQQRISTRVASVLVWMATCALHIQVLAAPAAAAELLESNLQLEGNVPSELSAAGEQQGPPLSSLMQGSNGKQIAGCTRRCVPTCIRGGEGAPGLGPISMRREIVVFKDGFRSRQYCLSECAQVCKLISDKEQQQQQQEQQQP